MAKATSIGNPPPLKKMAQKNHVTTTEKAQPLNHTCH